MSVVVDADLSGIPQAGGGGGTGNILSINTDQTADQTLTVGTTGTDFAIADNAAGGHAFNLPDASASARGALTSANWSTFNAKAPTASPTFTTSTRHSYATASTVPYFDANKDLVSSAVTPTQLSYLDATSSIQTQLNSKGAVAGSSSIVTVGTITSGTWNGTAIAAAYLTEMVGDSGAGGTKGVVPAPAAGDAAANKYLKASGAWATVSASLTYPLTADDSYSVTTPSYSRSGDPNTGIGFPAADNISLIAGGTQIWKYSLNANSGGYVGGVMGGASEAGLETYQITGNATRIKNYLTAGAQTYYYGIGPNFVNGLEIGSGSNPILAVESGYTSLRMRVGGVSMLTRTGGIGCSVSNQVSSVGTGNVGSGEDDLMTINVQANMLDDTGVRLHWKAFGTSASATSTLKVYLDTFVMLSSGAVTFGGDWVAEGDIIRTGTATQISIATLKLNGGSIDIVDFTEPTVTLNSGTKVLKLTATATNNDDINQKGFLAEWYPY